MINTFEFVGIPANVIVPSDVYEINQEVTTRFRTNFCRNEQLLQLLQRGMTYAQIHKLSETNQEISTVVLSIRDCDSQAIAPTSYPSETQDEFPFLPCNKPTKTFREIASLTGEDGEELPF